MDIPSIISRNIRSPGRSSVGTIGSPGSKSGNPSRDSESRSFEKPGRDAASTIRTLQMTNPKVGGAFQEQGNQIIPYRSTAYHSEGYISFSSETWNILSIFKEGINLRHKTGLIFWEIRHGQMNPWASFWDGTLKEMFLVESLIKSPWRSQATPMMCTHALPARLSWQTSYWPGKTSEITYRNSI